MPADGSSANVLSVGGLHVPYSVVSLVTLTVQNSALTILLHYSRTSPNAKPYSAAAAVLLNEILKGAISIAVALNNIEPAPGHAKDDSEPAVGVSQSSDRRLSLSQRKRDGSLSVAMGQEEAWDKRRSIATSHRKPAKWYTSYSQWRHRSQRLAAELTSQDGWKLAVPACCYVLQNNLQFVAAANLDVATFQVSYQMKILTTAFFSVTMLNKRLSRLKWTCLVALAVGVAIVQLQGVQTGSRGGASSHSMNRLTGFCAVTLACITSGFAGVYFEKVLKGSTTDLWIRNIQLTMFSLPPALFPALFPEVTRLLFGAARQRVADPNAPTWLFGNFGGWAMAVVSCQVFGGLVTALVIRYSDNIAKGFATSLSIIISFIAGIVLFEFPVTLPFLVGGGIVLAATWYYNQPDKDAAAKIRISNLHLNGNGSHAIDMSSSDMNGAGRISQESTGADPAYPFAEYPGSGTKPPKFINVSPFLMPTQKFSPAFMEENVSPRSPVPPFVEGQPFGPPVKDL